MKRSFFIILLSLSILNAYAQKEATWWYFGNRAGISFTGTGGAPVAQSNGMMNNWEGVASISDSKGRLIFYTDGQQVYTRKHTIMVNGGGGGSGGVDLRGHNSATQSAVIVQQPVRTNNYWIFTVDQEWGSNGFQYSIVDTTLNGNDGQVVQKNKPIMTPSVSNGSPDAYNVKGNAPEKVAAVKHANKVDTWIVNHTGGDNKFYVWLLNAKGLNPPVMSAVGPSWDMTGTGARGYSKGYMKFSPDGTKLICAIAGAQTGGGGGYSSNNGRIEIYDFDNLTGRLSNAQVIDKSNIKSGVGNISSVYGVEVSPNGRYLYISFYIPSWSGGDGNDGIWQLDLLAGNAAAIGNSCIKVANNFGSPHSGGGMQLGPDGKIYIARGFVSNGANYLSCISKPNCQGTACTFVNSAITLSSGRSSVWGVPTFINSFFNKAEFDWGSNAANLCENALTKLYITDSVGVDSAVWNFGDPSTGTKNVAKGFTVYHKFSSPKTYSVFVQLYRKVTSADCYADTARKKLTIFPNPKPNVGRDTVICQGEEVVLFDTSKVGTFIWTDGSTVPSYIANKKGWHWVAVKVGGCTGIDSMYLDVVQFPKFSLGNDTLYCQGDSVKLTANNGQNYLWSNGKTTQTIYSKDTGMVWARAGNLPRCYTYDTVRLATRTLPKLNLGRDTLLCAGDSIILNAKTKGAKYYFWNNFSTDTILKVKTSGIYWSRIKDTMCISLSDSIKIDFQAKVPFSIGKDTTFCKGGSHLVSATLAGAKTWLWKDNSTGSTFLAKKPGTEWVTVSNGTCIYRDTIKLAIDSILPFSLGNDTILCEGSMVDFIKTPRPNTEYTWMGTVKNYSYQITKTGKYYVELRDLPKKVCRASDTINVTFKKGVVINLGNDTSICVGQKVNLNVAKYGFIKFKWMDNDSVSGIRPNKNTSGTLNHSVSGFDGVCSSSDDINITYRPEIFIKDLGMDSIFCDNYVKTIDITAPGATTYEWKNGAGAQLATTSTYNVTTPGGKIVGIISDGFCYKRDSVTYTYMLTPVFSLGPDIEVCDGTLPTLDASGAAAQVYRWNTGASTPTITVPDQPKTQYYVDATNGNKCKSSDSIWVYFAIPPVVDLGIGDSIFCDAPRLNYDFSLYQDNTTFRWMDGYSLPTRKIKTPGYYWVVAENFCGYDSSEMNIKIDELGCRLYFPEIFSPNGDGLNDLWLPKGQVIKWVELVIYNRWGEVIYKGDPAKGWTGKIKDSETFVPDGYYPMTISYTQSNAGFPRLYVKNMVLTVIK